MTSRERIYVAACALPPSEERTRILESCTLDWRQERQPASTRKRILMDHYRQLLRVIEHEENFGTGGDGFVLSREMVPVHRESHAEMLSVG